MTARRTIRNISAGLSVAVLLLVGLTALSVGGCQKSAAPEGAAPAAKAQSESANARCPIMGSPIDPANVTPDLTREYHGKKVAFCCGGCPAAWDKLTDQQKDAKLAAAQAK